MTLHGIENGIVIMKRELGHNFMLTLATGYKNFDSYKFFIDYNTTIQMVFGDLIKTIRSSTKKYHQTIISYQGACAK